MLGPTGARLVMLNPIAPILEGEARDFQRSPLLLPLVVTARRGEVTTWTPWYLAYSAAWALGGLLVSVLFHRAEFAFAEYV